MVKQAAYDIRGTNYLDWVSGLNDTEISAHYEDGNSSAVCTNLELSQSDVLLNAIAKSAMLTTNAGKKIAVLSLMDPEYVKASNPAIAEKTVVDYEQAIETELASLRRSDSPPEVVVAMLTSIPTTDDEIEDAGSENQAKYDAIDRLIQEAIGVDVYILSGIEDMTKTSGAYYTTTNWAGDSVLVVPMRSSSSYGQSLEVIKATFNTDGLLEAAHSGAHEVELNCKVPESVAAADLVAAEESVRSSDMATPAAESAYAIDGVEIKEGDCTVLAADVRDDESNDEASINLITVTKCGCRVAQCEAGSLVADAMMTAGVANGANPDFAVINGGAIRAGLPAGTVSEADVHGMVPFLDETVVIKGMSASAIQEMLENSVSMLNDGKVVEDPDGRYLQTSKELRFEWYFQGAVAKVGTISICKSGAACREHDDFEKLSADKTYSVVVTDFMASGGDKYTMLEDGYEGQSKSYLHQSQYDVVRSFFRNVKPGDLNVATGDAWDLVENHQLPGRALNCPKDPASYRVCQTEDVVSIPIGYFCDPSSITSLQECDQAYHMAEVINNKQDGFLDALLPHARIQIHETHVDVVCSTEAARAGHAKMQEIAKNEFGIDGMFVATLGPGCSNDVTDITDKEWRDEDPKHRNNFVLSGSSTSSTLADDELYPNLARMSTSEVGVGVGFATLAREKFGWRRVAIVHDSSVWGTDSAKQFESAMIDQLGPDENNELIYMDFEESELDRTECGKYDLTPSDSRAKIVDSKNGCMPVTSLPLGKIRAGYPNGGEDKCEESNHEHFCVDKIVRKLKMKGAKIVFISAQRDTQQALFRAIYQHRDDINMDIYGEGYAYMSTLVSDALFVKQGTTEIDRDALQGAMGAIGITEPIDTTSDIWEKYTDLWDAASSVEACCEHDPADPATANCARGTKVSETRVGVPNNYCDTDGNGKTAASYSFSLADAVLALARALEYDNAYRDHPTDSNELYKDFLKRASDYNLPAAENAGITGKIAFEAHSGDRFGSLEVNNLKEIVKKNRRAVALSESLADFVSIGTYVVNDQGGRTWSPKTDTDFEFPGGGSTPPRDREDPKSENAAKIGPIIGGLVGAAAIIMLVMWWNQRRLLAKKDKEIGELSKTLVGVRHVVRTVDYASMGIAAPVAGSDAYIAVEGEGGASVGVSEAEGFEEEEPAGPSYRWYWQEGSDRMDSHNKYDVLQPGNWVSYAWGVCSELDNRFADWQAKKGPAKVTVDLTNRIASTGNEEKAFGQSTGVVFEIDFRNMTQTNLSSQFVRPINRVDVKPTSAEGTSFFAAEIPPPPAKKPSAAVQVSAGVPADLVGTEDFKLLITKPGQLVQQHQVRDDGWAFGAVLFDPSTGSSTSSPTAQVAAAIARKASGTMRFDDETGWFPLSCTELATATHLAKLQEQMGAGAAMALDAPPHWTNVKDALVAERHTLPDGTEKNGAVKAFMKSLGGSNIKVVSVERIQNMAMWQSYAVKRQGMMTRDKSTSKDVGKIDSRSEKRWLFHGTSADTVPKIIQQGFNRGFAGKNATAFGKGVYFAQNSSYSASTTYSPPDRNQVQQMFLCRVLTGFTCKGNANQLVPDIRDKARHILYDCTTNGDKTIYVTYHDSQQYPEYLVRFKQG